MKFESSDASLTAAVLLCYSLLLMLCYTYAFTLGMLAFAQLLNGTGCSACGALHKLTEANFIAMGSVVQKCCNVDTAAEGANLVGITQQEHPLQSLDTQRFQSCSVEFHKRLCWVDNRLDSIVKDVRDRLLLLGGGFEESLNVLIL